MFTSSVSAWNKTRFHDAITSLLLFKWTVVVCSETRNSPINELREQNAQLLNTEACGVYNFQCVLCRLKWADVRLSADEQLWKMALEGLSVRVVSDRWQHKFTFQTGMSSFSNNSDMLVVLCLCSKINTSKLFTYFAEIWIRCNNFAIYSVLSSFFSCQQWRKGCPNTSDICRGVLSVDKQLDVWDVCHSGRGKEE
jgi:hypothetical protein